MKKVLLTFLALFTGSIVLADEYPVIPTREIPRVKALPSGVPLILEVRGIGYAGDPEVGVFNLSNGSESVWEIPPPIPKAVLEGTAWSPSMGQLLLGYHNSLVLIGRDGKYSDITLTVHGVAHLGRYDGMIDYTFSPDGTRLAYTLSTRYRDDKLFRDLMVQQVSGSEPRSIAAPGYRFRPDWSPRGEEIAFRTDEDDLVVKDLNGATTFRTPPLLATKNIKLRERAIISLIRWSPEGNRLAFIADDKLYWVDKRVGAEPALTLKDGMKIDVKNFAWSPDGKQIVFRSSFEAGQDCNVNLNFYYNTGRMPCRTKYYLYTVNTDGSGLKRIADVAEYKPGTLFWIQ